MLSIVPNWCLLFSMCCAYADCIHIYSLVEKLFHFVTLMRQILDMMCG